LNVDVYNTFRFGPGTQKSTSAYLWWDASLWVLARNDTDKNCIKAFRELKKKSASCS